MPACNQNKQKRQHILANLYDKQHVYGFFSI